MRQTCRAAGLAVVVAVLAGAGVAVAPVVPVERCHAVVIPGEEDAPVPFERISGPDEVLVVGPVPELGEDVFVLGLDVMKVHLANPVRPLPDREALRPLTSPDWILWLDSEGASLSRPREGP